MPTPDSAPAAVSRQREQRGWGWYDWANSVFPTSVITVFLSIYLTSVATAAASADVARNGVRACPDALRRCDIALFGLEFPAGSLWGYLLSVATVVQVLVLPITGAVADRVRNKTAMLAGFAVGGAAATGLLALVAGTNWQLGVVLFVVANVCFSASVVVYYSFLPQIAAAEERDRVSARGWAIGYLGGGVALALHLGLYLGREALGMDESTAVRWVFASAGLWWAGFTVIPVLALRGASRRAAEPAEPSGGSPMAVLTSGFRQLWNTLRGLRTVPLTVLFLCAYWIYTDGIATVTQVAAQYGVVELRLAREALFVTLLIVQFIAYFGGLVHGWVARGIGAKRTILVSLAVWIGVLSAAYFVQEGRYGQFYALAAGIGLVLGGTNALSRSLFSQLIPPGREGEYFSLYEIGERSTSWLGPLAFAAIGQATGSFRLAIVSLIAFFAVGLLLVALLPVRRAVQRAGNRPPRLL